MQEPNRDDIIRRFWALLIGSKIEKDGQVKGFRDYWNKLSADAQRECDRYCAAVLLKIERDRRDPDECIAAGVVALKRELLSLPDDVFGEMRAPVDQVTRMIATIVAGLEPKARVVEVAGRPPLLPMDQGEWERRRAAQLEQAQMTMDAPGDEPASARMQPRSVGAEESDDAGCTSEQPQEGPQDRVAWQITPTHESEANPPTPVSVANTWEPID